MVNFGLKRAYFFLKKKKKKKKKKKEEGVPGSNSRRTLISHISPTRRLCADCIS